MVLNPNLVRSLVAVADTGTVTGAAEALGYSPSAVSQHIARLETQLGVELLRPIGRKVELTAQAEALVREAPQIFDAIENAIAAVESTTNEVTGRVRIGTIQSAAVQLIPAAVMTVRRSHPGIDVEVTLQPTARSIRETTVGSTGHCHRPGIWPALKPGQSPPA